VGTFQIQDNILNVDVFVRPLCYVAVSGCPANFMYIEEPHNLCYSGLEMNLQWLSASQYCRALDSRAHLVVINTAEEQEVLAHGLSLYSSKYKNWRDSGIWRKTGILAFMVAERQDQLT